MKKVLLFFSVLSFFGLLFAEDLKISVIDKELDFPLEGAKLVLKENQKIEAVADADGNAVLSLPDSVKSGTVIASFPGYKSESVKFSGTGDALVINMVITEVIEGTTLIVNRAAPEATDEKAGVSTVITKEQMHTTANIGLVEDCMASVRTLPGIAYSGAWGSEPSVRGAEPRELAFMLDGMYLIFPYHWGGGVSIFNPSMIESIKLSNGVYSARYGRGSAGVLDATSLKPDYENFHMNTSVSTTCVDAFFQVPFGKKVGGMLLGTHVSYLDPLLAVYKKLDVGTLDMLERAPYIRDVFLKTCFTPTDMIDISLFGFFGSDGITINQMSKDDGLNTHTVFDYDYYMAIGGLNLKYLPTDKLLFHMLFSYNGMFEDLKADVTEDGSIKYSDEFVDKFGSKYASVKKGASYDLPKLKSSTSEFINSHLFTGRFESEIELNEKNHLCAGIDESLSTSLTENKLNSWTDVQLPSGSIFKHVNWTNKTAGNNVLCNAAYASWTFGNESDFVQSELGLRGEFVNVYNPGTEYYLNFIPDVCPRASVTFTPWRDSGLLDKASFNIGSGLFVSAPRDVMLYTKDITGTKDYELNVNRALFTVLGSNVALTNGWNFKLETYYKYYLSRLYSYSMTDASSNYQDVRMIAKSNGKGHVFGVDSMIEKKVGGKWDGYLSYSFVFARLYNPAGIKSDEYGVYSGQGTLDEWYYPDYHRFHTVNVVSNWHFAKGWTFTAKATFATGAPKSDKDDITCTAAIMEDGTVIQRYSRKSVYSDTLRTNVVFPIDLRISYQWKTRGEKVDWEFYLAIQDLNFVPQQKDKVFNQYSGKTTDVDESSARFDLGVPIPSLGLKIKF